MMFCLLLRWIQVRRTTRFSRWLSNKSVSSSRKTINFGELVFLHGLRHPCIVRFVDMQVSEKVSAMRELIDSRRRRKLEIGIHRWITLPILIQCVAAR